MNPSSLTRSHLIGAGLAICGYIHNVVALPTGETRGGHMLEAYVWPTMELFLTAFPEPLVKVHDDETDLALFDLPALP